MPPETRNVFCFLRADSVPSPTFQRGFHFAGAAARAAVADILPLDDAPLQYLDYSLREVAERFGSFVKPEELDELDARLAAVESVRDMA